MALYKVEPANGYPIEEGHYVLGDNHSPVAVAVHTLAAKWSAQDEAMVQAAIDSGAAIAGSVQTPNLGVEKIIANVVSNPNIRYIVIAGAGEKEGMGGASAIRAVLEDGVDPKGVITSAGVDGAYLFNVAREAIDRFREQVCLINLAGETDAEVVGRVVKACNGETPTAVKGMSLYDPGAFEGPPVNAAIEMKVEDPFDVEEWEIDEILGGGGMEDDFLDDLDF
jgi:tetrahydromethanopterin S-methyltransferase subunit A